MSWKARGGVRFDVTRLPAPELAIIRPICRDLEGQTLDAYLAGVVDIAPLKEYFLARYSECSKPKRKRRPKAV